MKIHSIYPLALISLMTFPSVAAANKINKLDVSPLDGYDEAPTIEVYSTNGEQWNAVDKTQAVHFKVHLNAECKFEGKGNKAYEGDLTVAGFDIIGDTEPADFLIPHSSTVGASFRFVDGAGQPVKPIDVCDTELTKRLSENKNQTKYHILSKGFTVNYPGAFEVKYRLYCRAAGLGKFDLGSDTTLVNARIHCAASDLAEAKIPKPAPTPKAVPSRLKPLVKAISFEADPASHQGDCPVNIRFNGSITATRAGTVKYQYVSHDNRKSPEFTLAFKAAGTERARAWSRTLGKPDSGTKLAAAPGEPAWDYQGWYRLDILYPKPAKSVQANYQAACAPAKPGRAVRQK